MPERMLECRKKIKKIKKEEREKDNEMRKKGNFADFFYILLLLFGSKSV